MRRFSFVSLVAFIVSAPTAAAAQDGFFFRPPVVTLTIRAGQSVPGANDDLFDFFTRELTLERGDFAATSFGGELGFRVAPRFDIALSVAHAKSSQPSEFQHWVDNDEQPIEQVTTLKRVPVALSARFYPLDRGRAVGRYAWVPAALLPYVGAGVGLMWYDLTQVGDFVDFATLDIFYDRLHSSGTAVTTHVLAGAQWWPFTRAGLTAEARYTWGNSTLDGGFVEFGSIDLKGFEWTAGFAARF